MEETTLTVKLNGQDVTIEVLDIIEDNENNKEYIIYNPEGTEDVYMSILEEDETTYTLKTIENEEEAKRLESYLASIYSENGDE